MRLRPMDALWLALETAATPMHLGALAILQLPRGAGADYLQSLVATLSQDTVATTPWNSVLADAGISPRLQPGAELDLEYHFRHSALPQPGGERELGALVSRLHSQALDRRRPLWEFHLIEGLERDRFALYLKIHHALVRGSTAAPLLFSLFADSARKRRVRALWSRPLPSEGQSREADGEASAPSFTPGGLLAALGDSGRDGLRTAWRRAQAGAGFAGGAPRSTLNRNINAQRRFATQQFDRARFERLAVLADCDLNTLLAYCCGSSLRRFFKEYNALPESSLVASLPMSLRERSAGASAGLRIPLGTHIGDSAARLRFVKDAVPVERAERQLSSLTVGAPQALLRSLPVYVNQMPLLGRAVPPRFNLTISNTPGPTASRYLAGARLEAMYPLSPLFQRSALSIDCVSYADTLNVGFTGARDTLPHLQRLAVYAGRAMRELEQQLEEARL